MMHHSSIVDAGHACADRRDGQAGTTHWHGIIIVLVLLMLPMVALADEVYLINGCVYRNVQVVDSTATVLRITYNGRPLDLQRSMIDHVVHAPVAAGAAAVYEVYSQTMAAAFAAARIQQTDEERRRVEEEQRRAVELQDSLHRVLQAKESETRRMQMEMDRRVSAKNRVEDSLDRAGVVTWGTRNRLGVTIGFSHPMGLMAEFGFRYQVVALSFIWSVSDSWSAKPEENPTIGFAVRFHPMKPRALFDPYVGVMIGSAFDIQTSHQGHPETYRVAYLGTRLWMTRHVALTFEAGAAFTSKYLKWHYTRNTLVEGWREIEYPYLRIGIGIM